MQPLNTHALLVIDVQNGFCSNGNLPVARGDEVVPIINQLSRKFENVILTQDWHPADHISFAPNHVGKQPFESIDLPYGSQVLWTSHCVQNTPDAEFHPDLDIGHAQLIIRKGYHQGIDSYSAFLEADRKTATGLRGYLNERGIQTLYLVGLATDFCVAWSALDATQFGFECYVIEDACRAIDLNGSLNAAWQQMQAAGVKRIHSSELLGKQF